MKNTIKEEVNRINKLMSISEQTDMDQNKD